MKVFGTGCEVGYWPIITLHFFHGGICFVTTHCVHSLPKCCFHRVFSPCSAEHNGGVLPTDIIYSEILPFLPIKEGESNALMLAKHQLQK